MSCTWQKERVCVPSPWTSSGAPEQRAAHEVRDHHPVLRALTRPNGVEETGDHAVERPLLVVAERQELVQHLRVRVQPAALGRRAVHAPVVLVQRPLLAVVAVHLGAGRDQHALAEAVAVVEDGLGSLHVRDERVHRLLDDQADADGRSEVVDDVALVDELGDDGGRENGVHDEVEVLDGRGDASTLWIEPVERSSSAKTSQPSSSRSSTRCDPMKPAPPVISALGTAYSLDGALAAA